MLNPRVELRAVHAKVRVVADPAVRLCSRSVATAACRYVADARRDHAAELVDVEAYLCSINQL